MKKASIRENILKMRRRQPAPLRARGSLAVWKRLRKLGDFRNAGTVLFYVPLPDEVDTEFMIKESIRMGKKVLVPVSDTAKRTIIPSRIRDYEKELGKGPYGIPEPRPEFRRTLRTKRVDLVIVPGIAFDSRGSRLGFGAGFYDRYLGSLPGGVFIGLAFGFQVIKKVPSEPHDVRMHVIVTPGRAIECAPGKDTGSYAGKEKIK